MISVTSCPACGHHSWIKHLSCIDHTVSHETFEIKACASCGLLATNPRPADHDLHAYYQSSAYISHTDKATSLIDRLYKLARRFTLNWKESLLTQYSSNKSLLDYGCGTGDFLLYCQENKWRVDGVEPSPAARSIASEKLGKKIFSSIDDVRTNSYDLITLWHVFEHVPDLTAVLMKLQQFMRYDGTLFIAVPNYMSHDGNKYQSYWAGYDVPRHLWHFRRESLEKITTNSGLRIIATHPMKLDAYYVSLLSEKYKNNGKATLKSFIRAFLTGLRSNIMARKTGNYSSLIYVIKKHHA